MSPPADAPVHVLLLNWNGWRDTLECLESVFALDYPNLRVIVCDNASTDDSVQHIRDWADGLLGAPPPRAELTRHDAAVRKPISCVELDRAIAEDGGTSGARSAQLVLIRTGDNLGFAGGNNVGLRFLLASNATGYVWLLNNDTVVSPSSLRLMVDAAARDPAAGCVGATLLEYDRPDVIDAAGGGRLVRWQGMPRETTATGQRRGTPAAIPRRLDFITCGCLLAPLPAVARIGLIDERYFLYCEDIDYSLRMVTAGFHLALCAEAEIWHKGGSSVVYRSPRHDYYLVRSALLLVRKFHPILVPLALAYSLYRCALPKVLRMEGARLRAVARDTATFSSARRLQRAR